jgi:group II intron reverse transcriptase/maturase
MRNADTIRAIYQKRASRGLPLERVYRHLFDPERYLTAYGKIYRNEGATTKGTTAETVDGMNLQRIHNIIGFLKWERYTWTPVRRTEIPKANGKTRPLGIPTWSDKLLQEVLRNLLEPYYEQQFSDHSHGFRPHRSCHTALREIQVQWTGTVWFIEGDIKGCFDNIDHMGLLKIIKRDIHDGRLVKLIEGLLKAGYMEDWKYYDTLSGTPQGGIISPLLANIYLNELDKFMEDTLIPTYTKGNKRAENPIYKDLTRYIAIASKRNDLDEVHRLRLERRKLTSKTPVDPDYRRLRYVRYADDFLLGFVGPKNEAITIRDTLSEYLGQTLKLTLSPEKTLITHASDDKAKFLGHEITVTRAENKLTAFMRNGKPTKARSNNGSIALLMPTKVVHSYRNRFSEGNRIVHRQELLAETDYTIVQRYQSVLKGLYNFYCMTQNVSRRMHGIKWILETSLTKTLASKLRCHVSHIYKKYRVDILGRKMLRVVIQRPNKKPLVAIFGGFPIERKPKGLTGTDISFRESWNYPATSRSEVVQRLTAGKCELCGRTDLPISAHHIRKLADIDRPGRRPKEDWEKIMAARKRKSLMVCTDCHTNIHAGTYDGRKL